MSTTLNARQVTIDLAVTLIDLTGRGELDGYLAQTAIHSDLKRDPAALRNKLVNARGAAQTFSAWKAAQQLLKAAGLPY